MCVLIDAGFLKLRDLVCLNDPSPGKSEFVLEKGEIFLRLPDFVSRSGKLAGDLDA